MRSGRSRAIRLAIWASTLPALLAACFFYYPFVFSGPILCPMHLLLGLPCPGCGLTRAFCLASRGHFGEAYSFHPLYPLFFLYFAFLWGFKLVETWRGTPPALPTGRIARVALLAVFAFWAERLVFFFALGGLDVMTRDNLIARVLRWLA